MALVRETILNRRPAHYWHIDAMTWQKGNGLTLHLAGYGDADDRALAAPEALARTSVTLPDAAPADFPAAYRLLKALPEWAEALDG